MSKIFLENLRLLLDKIVYIIAFTVSYSVVVPTIGECENGEERQEGAGRGGED